ncbi:chemotaxis protein CheW [Nitrincola alkalisediminis]|uniref:chemotaxis protein CheW n=1 Tax=Nitrincola alkalisediminis TaxID=1366656 RepID=UPI0018760031|nr:chemotaxis protein CheW [Nitrincola alkalisediminis]
MSIDLSQFHQVFIDEAYEHLDAMEQLLLAIDIEHPNLDDLNAIFRAAHSIKGGSGTFGFSNIADLTHALESLLDKLRKETLPITHEMVSAFLACGDLLKLMLEAHQDGGDLDEQRVTDMKTLLLSLGEEASILEDSATHTPTQSPVTTYRIRLHPDSDIFSGPASFEALVADLSRLGTLILIADQGAGRYEWTLTGSVVLQDLLDTFAFICQDYEVTITEEPAVVEDEGFGFFMDLPEPSSASDADFGFFVDESELPASQASEDSGFGFFVDETELPAVKQAQQETEQGFGFFVPESELPKQAASIKESPAAVAPVPVSAPRKSKQADASKAHAETSIRVGVEKVDQLINLVGELVITRSMLAQSVSELDPVHFETIHKGLVNLERNSRDLQEAVMSIRMLPINFVFGRFPRVVRDLTQKMSKKVRLKLVGEETELDKGLIEKLADPLTHLLRNSIDHGIEIPEVRRAAGKPEEGTITLSASHQGGSILVQITDDGAGLDREKLIAKAREKGLPLSDNPTDKEVWQLIFAPGFSTAKEVTDVSGRGVGMDVVQRNISEMKGQVEIESAQGVGTTIGLRLPLTLAILDGMILRVADEVFVLPLTRILESFQPDSSQMKSVAGQGRVVQMRGEYLPLVELHKLLGIQPQYMRPEEGILVVVETTQDKVALFVDELIAQQQVVIKSLETHFRKVDGLSGATIMGDGRVALILDIDRLARMHSTFQAHS